MNRFALLAASLLALALTACENKTQEPIKVNPDEPAPTNSNTGSLDNLDRMEPVNTSATQPPMYPIDRQPPSNPPPRNAGMGQPEKMAPAKPSAHMQDEPLVPVGKVESTGRNTRTYTVKKGDTLIGIARKFYNDGSKWTRIRDANRNRVKDPKKLDVGTNLIIP